MKATGTTCHLLIQRSFLSEEEAPDTEEFDEMAVIEQHSSSDHLLFLILAPLPDTACSLHHGVKLDPSSLLTVLDSERTAHTESIDLKAMYI